jgi:flavin-binding protein dodecin
MACCLSAWRRHGNPSGSSPPGMAAHLSRWAEREEAEMAVVKVIELLAESEQSWEDAARQAVAEATKSVRGISSVYISEFQATVENDQVKNFRINAKISFVLERS